MSHAKEEREKARKKGRKKMRKDTQRAIDTHSEVNDEHDMDAYNETTTVA